MTSSSEIRTWARSQGLKVGDRGRLHPSIALAYEKAHSDHTPGAETVDEISDAVKAHYPDAFEENPTVKKYPRYLTGFCQYPGKENGHRHCPTVVRNGAAAPRQEIPCECVCHE